MAQSEIDDAFAVLDSEAIGKGEMACGPFAAILVEGRREFASRARRIIVNINARACAGRFGVVALQVLDRELVGLARSQCDHIGNASLRSSSRLPSIRRP